MKIILGFRQNDDFCTPLALIEDLSSNSTLSFLNHAIAVFTQWKASGLSEITNEMFTACIQSKEAMKTLAFHLFSRYGFKYVLPGKFTSDPIEKRFGWYHQVNGRNFYMSILQLFQAEKIFVA